MNPDQGYFAILVFFGDSVRWSGDKARFMGDLTSRMNALAKEGDFTDWE
jgi:hypothetical protein